MKHRNWWQSAMDGSWNAPKDGGEKRDCVPRALALLCGASYADALELTRLYGRKSNRGMNTYGMVSLPTFKFNGCTFREVDLTGKKTFPMGRAVVTVPVRRWKTVGSFVKAHPKGRYLLRVKGHVLPVIDGVVTDWSFKPRRHLTWAFEVTEAK
jgi:hypothetical protein